MATFILVAIWNRNGWLQTVWGNYGEKEKKQYTEKHFGRLADGLCSIELSPYYNSMITGLERVADHLVNIGFSVINPVGEEE